jgi:hypothetical protein
MPFTGSAAETFPGYGIGVQAHHLLLRELQAERRQPFLNLLMYPAR